MMYSYSKFNSIKSNYESNDCVVRSFATAFDISYDEAHDFCKNEMKRKDRKGVMTFYLLKVLNSGNKIFGKIVKKIEYDPVEVKKTKKTYFGEYTESYTYNLYTKRGKTISKLTVGTFIKNNPKGTFLISVRGHLFVVKDSKIFGNLDDYKQKRKIINSVWIVK